MDIAVKHSWVENLEEAKNFKNMTGMLITDVLELKLTATGKWEIIDEDDMAHCVTTKFLFCLLMYDRAMLYAD
jgi:hypothetical protein